MDQRLEDGYELWLRYRLVSDPQRLASYREAFARIVLTPARPTLRAAVRELPRGLSGLLGGEVPLSDEIAAGGAIVAGTPRESPWIASLGIEKTLGSLGKEGFVVRRAMVEGSPCTVIAASEDIGVLYGVFHLLHRLQTHADPREIEIDSRPKLRFRVLNHWDNLDRT